MNLTVNGARHDVDAGTTLAALMLSLTGTTRGSAAVVDGEVVPRSTWNEQTLREGQVVELITAVQGG